MSRLTAFRVLVITRVPRFGSGHPETLALAREVTAFMRDAWHGQTKQAERLHVRAVTACLAGDYDTMFQCARQAAAICFLRKPPGSFSAPPC